jgi:hypothetical protein
MSTKKKSRIPAEKSHSMRSCSLRFLRLNEKAQTILILRSTATCFRCCTLLMAGSL